ncbi:cytochrome P450 [Nocardioides humilatus]|uniref:Cytochrome P450 n=1 Tax=Nocardioides humilatus TaxID=2607660 RepID=A0A5B1LLI6_9ACTN|nr:cytochrome P450 [Nocardioides humilatus]KAA1421296.1 cytochrome P450 [Nocardioides humilatus]
MTTPSIRSFPGDRLFEAASARLGTKVAVLAEPPAGSGLKPVYGEPGLPGVGKTVEMLRHGFIAARRYSDRHGPVFWTNAFGRKIVWTTSPEAAKEVLTTKSKSISQAGWRYFIEAFFERGLMLLDGQEHLLHRRIMQEAFTRPRLEGYTEQFTKVIDNEMSTWPVNEQMLLNPAVKDLSLAVATVVFMGADPHQSDHLTRAFVDAVRGGTGIVRVRVPGASWLRWNKGLAGRKVLEEYFRAEIGAKRASGGDDLFAALCHARTEDGEEFTDDDVVNHMIFLMMAAHDTTTITSTTIAYYLAKYPELQEAARAESEALRGEPITLELLDKLEIVDRVFMEGMRLVAPVPVLGREATEDMDICGQFVPKGTLIAVVSDPTHRNESIWTHPDDFDIDRFVAPRSEQKGHRFAHIPFGGGAHKCIGMVFGSAEVKAIIHRMLLNYRIEIPADYELQWDYTSLVVPVDGFPVTLRPLA